MLKVLSIVGTRPEAIKMAPVIQELERYPYLFESIVCATAQHREMLDQILDLFSIVPDYDLNLMSPGQSLAQLTSRVIYEMDEVFEIVKPDLVLVQGDTTTVMAAGLAAFFRQIPVGHVEAGLRSKTLSEPFPEELNRRIAGLASSYHFAPTATACVHLLKEGVPSENICISGNTVIDALLDVTSRPHQFREKRLDNLDDQIILVTAHRRESFGRGLENICDAVARLANEHSDLTFVYPVHPNPNVRMTATAKLSGLVNMVLTDPLDYADFAHLMKKSLLILTDSGGVQEEAPSLGIPVLVLRNVTERVEAIESGAAILVGTDTDKIVAETNRLLEDRFAYKRMASAGNPYGDGHAAQKIVRFIAEKICHNTLPQAGQKKVLVAATVPV